MLHFQIGLLRALQMAYLYRVDLWTYKLDWSFSYLSKKIHKEKGMLVYGYLTQQIFLSRYENY